MERLAAPVGVTAGRRAALHRVGGPRLLVGIVAHPTRLARGVARRIEVRQLRAHLVATEALVGPGAQRPRRRIAGREEGHLGSELVARDAVHATLSRHLAEADLRADVTPGLAARRVHGHEAVDFYAVAGRTLDLTQRARVRLEMHAVARSRRDPAPLVLLFVALHVTRRAHARRHLRVHLDLLGPVGHPQIQLAGAGEDRLL